MTYEEMVQKVKEAFKLAKVSKTVGHVAFQFNVEGDAEGAFYLKIDDGKISVEPYEYYDRNVLIVGTANTILEMAEGKLQPMSAYLNEQIKVYGNVDQLEVLPFVPKRNLIV